MTKIITLTLKMDHNQDQQDDQANFQTAELGLICSIMSYRLFIIGVNIELTQIDENKRQTPRRI